MKLNAFTSSDSLPSIRFGFYEHAKWKDSHLFFVFMCMATCDVLDISNVIFHAYEEGITYWILYFLMTMAFGVPLVYLECQMGQFFGQTSLNVIRNVCPVSTGVGVVQLLSLWFYLIRDNIHLGLLIHYTFSVAIFSVPWTKCGHYWSSKNCFTVDQWLDCFVKDGSIFWNNSCYLPDDFCEAFDANLITFNTSFCVARDSDAMVAMLDLVVMNHTTPGKDYYRYVMGSGFGSGLVDAYTIVYYSLAWIITCTSGYKGIHASPIPICNLAFIFTTVTATLLCFAALISPQGLSGFKLGLEPVGDMELILQKAISPIVWQIVIAEVYTNCRVGYGTNSFLGSFNQFNCHLFKPILFAQLYAFSFNFVIASFAYSMTGILSKADPKYREYEVYQRDVDSIKNRLPSPGYSLYLRDASDVFGHHEMPNVWPCTFFLTMFFKTLCCTLCTFECIVVSVYDLMPYWRKYRVRLRIIVAVIGWTSGLIFFGSNPSETIPDIFNAVVFNLNIVVFVEILIFTLVYGFASKIKLRHLYDLKAMVGWDAKFYVYLQFMYYIALPVLTMVHAVFSVLSTSFPVHVFTATLVSFLLVTTPVFVIGYAVYAFWKRKGQRLTSAFLPTKQWLAQPILSKEATIINYPTSSWRYKFYYVLRKLGFNY